MTNFKVKYLFEERRKNNPVKLGTCINHDLFSRQTRLSRREIAGRSCSFSSRTKSKIQDFWRNVLTNVSIMRGKKRNTLLRIEIHFFAIAVDVVTLFYSLTMLNLNLRFEYRRSQKDFILSPLSLPRILYQTRESWRSDVINGLNLISCQVTLAIARYN